MRSKKGNQVASALLVSLLSMLIPMILATRVLKSALHLSLLYMVGYTILIVSILVSCDRESIQIDRNSISALILYVIVLILPLVNDIVQGVTINFYDPINSLIKIVNFFIFYMLIENIEVNKEAVYRFVRAVVILSVIACLFSIFFEFDEILSIRYVSNTNTLRIRSFFSNRNQYAAFLVIGLIANLYSYQLKKQKRNILIFILQILCILSTFSRAALFSSIIIIALMVLQMRDTKKKIALLLLALIIGVGFVFTTGVFDYFIKNYIRWSQGVDSGRFILWKYAWDTAKINLFTGVGFYTGVDIAISNGMGLDQFHNMFFDLLVDGGIFEVFFIIGMFYSVYRRCSQKCVDMRLLAVYRASFAAFIFHACFESLSVFALSYSDTMYSIFFVSLPLLLSKVKGETPETKAPSCTQTDYSGA